MPVLAPAARTRRGHARRVDPTGMSTARLLDTRLCDLELRIEGTWLASVVDQAREELAARDIRIRPHFWLSEEWACYSRSAGITLPFYLAHPRLARLEREQMLEVEGASRRDCMRLLRHELGHAVDHSFCLSREAGWRAVFGDPNRPYPRRYRPTPSSRHYVRHLDGWYAQAHPAEDFAETFAVWLDPHSDWRRRYRDWPVALRKLEYVDRRMAQLAGQRPRVWSRAQPDRMAVLRQSLGEYYAERRSHFRIQARSAYDAELCRIFATPDEAPRAPTAYGFLWRSRTRLRAEVGHWSQLDAFTVEQELKAMMRRCRALNLRIARGPRVTQREFAALLAARVHQRLQGSRPWQPM